MHPAAQVLRWHSRLLMRLVLAVAAILLILAALWQFWFIPRLEHYRPMLVAEFSRATGMQVQIRELGAGWDGVRPRLSLRGVQVSDPAGQAALQFAGLEGALSWWILPLGELHFSRITLDAPELSVSKRKDGRWQVAGVMLESGSQADSGFLQWLLDQGSLSITRGRLALQDEQGAGAPLVLTRLDVQASNLLGRRKLRFSFTPPGEIGLPVRGEANLSGRDINRLNDWSGRLSFDFPGVNLARLDTHLHAYLPDVFSAWPVLQEGQGRLGVGFDFSGSTLNRLDASLGLDRIRLEQAGHTFVLPAVDATAQWTVGKGKQQLIVEARNIEGASGALARNGRAEYMLRSGEHELSLRGFSLAGLSAYAQWLPGEWAGKLAGARVAGEIADLRYAWRGAWQSPTGWRGEADLRGLDLAVPSSLQHLGRFDVKASFDDKTGQAAISSGDFQLAWPAQFVEPLVLSRIDAALKWKRIDQGWEIQSDRMVLVNPETSLAVTALYRRTGQGLGYLDLQADATRLAASRVHVYLPRVVGDDTLTWLRQSLRAGQASNIRIALRGELDRFPFADGAPGIFRATADARDVTLSFADDWPAITGIDGALLFEGQSMTIRSPRARIFDVRLKDIVTRIPDLSSDQHVLVDGKAEGQTAGFLRFVRGSPVRTATEGFLDGLQATGNGELGLRLDVPIDDTDKTTVQGRYRFAGNRLDFGGNIPVLNQANGLVDFSETSLKISEATASSLGGKVRLSGASDRTGKLRLGLAGDAQLGEVALRYALPQPKRLSGNVGYQGELLVARDSYDFSLQSPLTLARIELPAPLGKPAGETRAFRLRIGGDTQRNTLEFGYGRLLQAALEQQGEKPYAGQISLGAVSPRASASPRGIQLFGKWPELDLAAWQGLMAGGGGAAPAISNIDLAFDRLSGWGKRLTGVQIKAAPTAQGWSGQLASQEAAGSLSWRAGEAMRLTGRLERLHLPLPSAPPGLADSREMASSSARKPASSEPKPALDLVVEDFRYKGSELGRLVVNASPSGDGWLLSQVTVTNPDGRFSMTGNWQGSGASERTTAKISLKSENTGKLLERLGYADALRRAPASLAGEGSWQGSPFSPLLETVQGKLNLDVRAGQFARIEPGAGRLLAILSLQALPRRIKLDFRDIFSDGLEFDSIKGDATIDKGILRTSNLAIDGPAAKIRFKGEANLPAGTQNLRVRIAPLMGDMASLAVGVGNPIAGVAAFAVQRLLKDPLGQMVSYEYQISGDMLDPQVRKVSGETP